LRLRYRNAVEHAACITVLTLIPVLLLLPGVLRGALPIDTASILSLTPWEEARPGGVAADQNPGANLTAQRYYPWYVFISEAGSPLETLWNPLEHAGQPFLAVWRTRCLSVFTAPFYLGDVATALTISIFLKLWIAGGLAFYAARRLGLSTALAMIPAVSFQLCGPLVVWSVFPISDVLPWFPLLFLLSERLALGEYRAWPGGVIAVAAMLLGGEPEACAVLIAVAILYFFVRAWNEWHGAAGAAAAAAVYAGALGLALCIACVQILPYIELLRFAVDAASIPPQVAPSAAGLSGWLLPYAEMPGHAATTNHAGIPLLIMVPAWLSLRSFADVRTRRRCEAVLVPVVLLNVLAFFWPRLREFTALASYLHPEHLLMINGFGLGLVAAFAADEWNKLGVDEIKSTLKRFLILCPLIVGSAATPALWPGLHEGGSAGPWWAVTLAFLLIVATLASLGATVLRPSMRIAGYALALILSIDLLITFFPVMPSTPKAEVFPETPFVALLKKTGGRVTGSAALGQWPLAGNNVPQLYGAAGVVMKHQRDFAERAAEDPLLSRRSGSPLLLLKQEDIQGSYAPIREMLKVEQVFPAGAVLFYDTEAKERAWMAYEVRNVEQYSPDELQSGLPVLVEQGVPPPPLPPDKEPGTVTIEPATSNSKVTVTLDGVSKGILVLADAYFPGWEARIDGESTRVFPADLLFRGVEVPEGATEIVFEYKPTLIIVGLVVSGLGILILLIGMTALVPSTLEGLKATQRWGA